MATQRIRDWIVDIALGAIVGGVIGAIAAVNLVIFSGADRGYESSLSDVFEHSTLTGIITVAVLAAGPVLGVVVARKIRNGRTTG